MPYLTLWDKISQNLANLEGNSHKTVKSHRIFRLLFNIFYEEINISFLHELKDFRQYWRSSKVMFKKLSQNFVKSPLILPYLTDFSPQLMACMRKLKFQDT